MGMAIHGGNRRLYIHVIMGHGHGYIELIEGCISTKKYNSNLLIYITKYMLQIKVDI